MTDPRRPESERKALSHDASERLLRRAAELDAAEKSSAEVDKLRAAAVEAGISRSAFDAALSEMRDPPSKLARRSPTREQRVKARVIGTLVLIAVVAIGLMVMVLLD